MFYVLLDYYNNCERSQRKQAQLHTHNGNDGLGLIKLDAESRYNFFESTAKKESNEDKDNDDLNEEFSLPLYRPFPKSSPLSRKPFVEQIPPILVSNSKLSLTSLDRYASRYFVSCFRALSIK